MMKYINAVEIAIIEEAGAAAQPYTEEQENSIIPKADWEIIRQCKEASFIR